jgi:putative tryptophan/tyrosine transport system substrate-binding protein
MIRRKLVVIIPLGYALATLSRAQARPKLIGVLGPYSEAAVKPAMESFSRAMKALGYEEGRQFAIVERSAEGSNDRLKEFAQELVQRKVDVICAATSNAAAAAQRATATIPIVFLYVQDPVASGFAESLARPGHNMTGLSNFNSDLIPKRLEFLKQMLPLLSRVALLVNPSNPFYPDIAERIQAPAEKLGLHTLPVNASRPAQLESAFEAMRVFKAEAIYVLGDPFLWNERVLIANLALRNRIPTMSSFVECVEAGGLMSYSPVTSGAMVQMATYVDKIFKGIKPADIPIEQPTQVELVLNRKTAIALGIAIPKVLLLQAERVID